MSDNTISKSKQKRLDMANARKQQKAKKALSVFWAIIIPLAVIGIVAGIIIYNKVVNAPLDYSKYLTDNGTIAGISNIDDYVTCSYENMTFAKADLMPADEYVDENIENVRQSYAELNSTAVSADGDKVNIYYTSYIDGAIYNSSSAENSGSNFVIGTASISEDFDNALIGHKAGDAFIAEITFPEDDLNAERAGKTVTYDIAFNGVYVAPEFDDAFVAEHFADTASTVEEYKNNLIDQYYRDSLTNAIASSISMNTIVTQYPEDYVRHASKILAESNQADYEYYAELYASYGLDSGSLYEFYGYSTQEEYEAELLSQAYNNTADMLAYQAVFIKSGMTNTREDVLGYFTSNGTDEASFNGYVDQYGYNYIANIALQGRVLDYLCDVVTVTE